MKLTKCTLINVLFVCALLLLSLVCLCACSQDIESGLSDSSISQEQQRMDNAYKNKSAQAENNSGDNNQQTSENSGNANSTNADELRQRLNIQEDYRSSFVHGEKPASCQKYIVLHDTEGNNDASSVISGWDSNGRLIAAHFVINKDGSVYQCVELDKIAHHVGFGNTGHNEKFGVSDESRDDKEGSTPIGSSYADYGMNSYSVGIELVHVGGEGQYPQAQLDSLDNLIAYIDAYYGFESEIIDHKEWRTTNSDTSEEFSEYLQNYKSSRHH